jgi:FkbM family methyltransferase
MEDLLQADPEVVLRNSQQALDRLMAGGYSNLVLFGAGGLGRKVASGLQSIGVQPLAFADNNQSIWGTDVCGLPVLSPAEAVSRYANNALFLITIWRWPATETSGQRKHSLLDLGAERVCSVIPLFWKYPEHFLPYYCLDLPHKLPAARTEIKQAYDLLADDASRHEFGRQLLWRFDPESLDLDQVSDQLEYFPQDLFQLSDSEVFVDVGGYDGDTAREFLRLTGNKVEQLHIIEADPGTFKRLVSWRSELATNLQERIFLHNLAASDSGGVLNFSANSAVDSHITITGQGVEVPCDQLDVLLADMKAPTLVKMDIEGAEASALTGMRGLIREHKPILAICLYHRQDDIWAIPNLINSFASDYRFFLKAHSLDGGDLVLYAVPPAR